MFCTKCGTKNDENSRFCENCGAALSEIVETENSVQDKPVSDDLPKTQNEMETTDSPVEEASETQEETVQQSANQKKDDSSEEADFIVSEEINPEIPEVELKPVKNSGKTRKVLLIALAVCVLGVLFWDSVLAAVAPKLYAQTVLTRTIDKVNDEMMKSEKNILGFNVEKEKEITASIEGILNEVAGKDLGGVGFKMTAKNSEKKKKLMYSAELVYDGDTFASGLFMLDDKNIYIDSPEFFKDSLSVPSKNFGKAWNNSDLADELDIKLSDDIDLSYSNLFKKNKSFLSKKSDKAIEKEIAKLVKASEVKTSKGSASVNEKTVNTKTVEISIDPDDLEDMLKVSIDIIEEDENIKELSEATDESEEAVEELFDGLREGVGVLCDNIDDEIVLELQVYKGKAVNIALEFEVKHGPTIRMETAFEDSKTFINDMKMLIEVKMNGEKVVLEANSEGNHVAKGKVFTDETVIEVKAAGQKLAEFEHTMTMDMKKSDYEQEFSAKVNDGGEALEFGFSFEGTCSNKKEFKLVIDKFKFKGGNGDMAAEVDLKIKGQLSLTITPKAKFDKVNTSGTLNVLEADEDDLQKWAEGVGEKTEEFVKDNEDLFKDMMFKGEKIFPQSYPDYYYGY